jgi:hypothetical protein
VSETEAPPPGQTEARLKQFEVLWAEIARRSTAQQALVGATATATATVGALAVEAKAGAVLLVVLAAVSPVFGLLWLDHALNIGQIAEFIGENWRWKPSWETFYDTEKRGRSGRVRYVMFVLSMTLVFLAPAVAGLVASVGHLDGDAGRISAWAAAAAITLLYSVAWSAQIVRGWGHKSTTPPLSQSA